MIKFMKPELRNIIYILIFLFIPTLASAMQQQLIWTVPVQLEGANTSADDFGPAYNRFDENLYFNSTESGYSRFYHASIADSFSINPKIELTGGINKPRNNQSYISFLESDIAYISSYRLNSLRSYINLFVTRKKRKDWLEGIPLRDLEHDSFTGHASISPSGDIMIFTSDRRADTDDTDLWMALRQVDGSWGPILRIEELSTFGNEITPFLKSSDTLYFASDGHEGPGGYDLFMSVKSEGKWLSPDPLVSFNTESNESDPCVLPDGSAIFASDRPGGSGGLDLYISYPVGIKKHDRELLPTSIVISPQVSSVYVNNSGYSDIVMPFGFFRTSDLEMLTSVKWEDVRVSDDKERLSFDSIYKYSLPLIAKRFALWPVKPLHLVPTGPDKSGSDIESFFADFNTRPNSIIIDKPEKPQGYPEGVSVLINDETLLIPFPLNKGNMEFMPPVLELSIDARPRNQIESWKLYLGHSRFAIDSGRTLPAKTSVPIANISEIILQSDNISFNIVGNDIAGKQVKNNIELPIIHVFNKSIESYRGRPCRNLFLPAVSMEQLIKYTPTLQKKCQTHDILVQYYSDNCSQAVDYLVHNLQQTARSILSEKADKSTIIDRQISDWQADLTIRIIIFEK